MLNTIKNTEGEIELFEGLYRLYSVRLKRYAFEYIKNDEETADIIQNLFMILWQRRSELHEVENQEAYIFTIARNLCVDFLRKKLRQAQHLQEDPSDSMFDERMNLLALEDFQMNNMDFSVLQKQVTQILSELPAETRETFLLSRQKGLRYRDIASLQSISIKTVEKRISNALCSLRAGLQIFM
ncbi:MAG: RNA polymerase sigma-70 factor [Bacteroidales bacterium]